jgi:hypothetical protein
LRKRGHPSRSGLVLALDVSFWRSLPRGSLNRPERKLLPRFNARILKVNQIKVTVATRTDERIVLCEDKGLVGAAIFRDFYSHNHAVLITQPVDGQNFCGNGGHWS